MGIALESRRLDKLEEVILCSSDIKKTLKYALHVCQSLVIAREFRQEVRRVIGCLVHSNRKSWDLQL